MFACGLCEVDEQPAVIELPIVVQYATAQAFLFECGNASQDFLTRKQHGSAKAILPG
jgi:hypothetical protein